MAALVGRIIRIVAPYVPYMYLLNRWAETLLNAYISLDSPNQIPWFTGRRYWCCSVRARSGASCLIRSGSRTATRCLTRAIPPRCGLESDTSLPMEARPGTRSVWTSRIMVGWVPTEGYNEHMHRLIHLRVMTILVQ